MKTSIILLLVLPLCLHAQQSFNALTFNIRLNTSADKENAWPLRIEKVCSQIQFHKADILGVQEALYEQVLALDSCLPGFERVGAGRDDGKNAGEFSAIYINTKRFKVLESSTFWLSETTDIPGSKSWDAAITRVCTWAWVKDKSGKKKMLVLNTHFDHIGEQARLESAKLIRKAIDSLAGSNAVLLMGDFNSNIQQPPGKELTKPTGYKIPLFDTKDRSVEKHYGPSGTFNAFGSKEINDDAIDYIFITMHLKVLQHATLSQSWQGRFSSDHFPVLAVLSW